MTLNTTSAPGFTIWLLGDPVMVAGVRNNRTERTAAALVAEPAGLVTTTS